MKIEEQVLSRKQMAHLVELGIDTSDASMCWIKFANSEINEYHLDIYDGTSYKEMKTPGNIVRSIVPTYTIGDLIEKLPKEINDYHLEIRFDDVFNHISYYISDWELTDYLHKEDMHNTPTLDALYKTLCWVAENHKELIK